MKFNAFEVLIYCISALVQNYAISLQARVQHGALIAFDSCTRLADVHVLTILIVSTLAVLTYGISFHSS